MDTVFDPKDKVELTPEEIDHKKKGSEIFKLLSALDLTDTKVAEQVGAAFAPAAPAEKKELFAEPASPAHAEPAYAEPETSVFSAPAYTEPAAPAHAASEYDYIDHPSVQQDVPLSAAYTDEQPVYAETAYAEPSYVEPSYGESAADVYAPSPLFEEEENEDSRPTRRTMDTLRRAAADQQQAHVMHMENVGFFASLSSRTKLVLAIVAAVVVVAIALICINAGIINSIDADIEARRVRLEELSEEYKSLTDELERMSDPAYVDYYAENVLGWTRG